MSINLNFVQTHMAPTAVGPYSQAVRFGNLIFFSGQIGIEPQTGLLVSDDFKLQTEQVFKNLSAIISASGCTLQDVIKVEIFLTNIENFEQLNELYEKWFGYHKPARQTVEVSRLPKNAKLEISLIAGSN